MADQIPLYPVRSAAVAAASHKRAAYYSAAGPGPGANRRGRYQLEDESAPLDEMPLMMSEEGFENDESDYHTLPRARITRRKRGLEWFVCGGWKFLCTSCCDWLINVCQRKKELKARTVWLGCPEKCEEKHPRNSIKNQKYNVFTFIPGVTKFIQYAMKYWSLLKPVVQLNIDQRELTQLSQIGCILRIPVGGSVRWLVFMYMPFLFSMSLKLVFSSKM